MPLGWKGCPQKRAPQPKTRVLTAYKNRFSCPCSRAPATYACPAPPERRTDLFYPCLHLLHAGNTPLHTYMRSPLVTLAADSLSREGRESPAQRGRVLFMRSAAWPRPTGRGGQPQRHVLKPHESAESANASLPDPVLDRRAGVVQRVRGAWHAVRAGVSRASLLARSRSQPSRCFAPVPVPTVLQDAGF